VHARFVGFLLCWLVYKFLEEAHTSNVLLTSREALANARASSIGKVVPIDVLVSMDLIGSRWSMAFNKSSKHQKPLQHVDIIA
jgi:hypothetical protein